MAHTTSSGQNTHQGFAAVNRGIMDHSTAQAVLTARNAHVTLPSNPDMGSTAQGIQYHNGRNGFATEGLDPAAIPRNGFTPASQYTSASNIAYQDATTFPVMGNVYQAHRATHAAHTRPGLAEVMNVERIDQQPRPNQGGGWPIYNHPSEHRQRFPNDPSIHQGFNQSSNHGIKYSQSTGQPPRDPKYIGPFQSHLSYHMASNGYQSNGQRLHSPVPPPVPGHFHRPEGVAPMDPRNEYVRKSEDSASGNISNTMSNTAIIPNPQGSSHIRDTSDTIFEQQSVQNMHEEAQVDEPMKVALPASNTAPTQANIPSSDPTAPVRPRHILSSTEQAQIEAAAHQVLLAISEAPQELNPPVTSDGSANPKINSPLSALGKEYDPKTDPPQIVPNVPEKRSAAATDGANQLSNQVSGPSPSGQPAASKKRHRGRPNKEEQRIGDLEDPERARLREEKKAARKAARNAQKQAAKEIKERQSTDPPTSGSSIIKPSNSDNETTEQSAANKPEDIVEEVDLYSADGESQKSDSRSTQTLPSATRKRAATTILNISRKQQRTAEGQIISRTEHSRAQSEGAISINSSVESQDKHRNPGRESHTPLSRPGVSSSQGSSSDQGGGSRQRSSSTNTIVVDQSQIAFRGSIGNPIDVENLEENAAPVFGNNILLQSPLVVIPPPAELARKRMRAYFGREYCQQHEIRELKRSRIYHSSTPVQQVPENINYVLTCSAPGRVNPGLPRQEGQKALRVMPNEFGSISNAQFIVIIDFIHEALGRKKKLFVAGTSDNDFESKVIDGLAVMACVLASKKETYGETKTTVTLNYLQKILPEWRPNPFIEFLDDLDFWFQWGRGYNRWNKATNQWREFVDEIGATNKRRNAGPDMEYIEVNDFQDILNVIPLESTAKELKLPVPFNQRTLAKQVLDWWEAQTSDKVPFNFSRTKLKMLAGPEIIEQEEEWSPMNRGSNEDEGYHGAEWNRETLDWFNEYVDNDDTR
ncbi:hypothetical protein ONS96_000954 [Cadophora gregata f. sp. sojae]|nr:hypothetical protein ONS96_000954 [Cadophora gregata f. sp. sojae]